jgi:hypothetical protein
MLIYKIQFSDGLFSKGGMYPRKSKTGKIWKNIGHLKNHLRLADYKHLRVANYEDAKIVVYEISDAVMVDTIEIKEIVELNAVADHKREAESQKRIAEYRRQAAEKMLKEANAMLDSLNKGQ